MESRNWILNAPMSKAHSMMYDFHVLLVDHDSDAHAPLIDMFESLSCKVTSARLASKALYLLSQRQPKFDLLIENIKSPDSCGYKLLQIAIQMDIPVILLLDEDDVELAKRAMENGVLLCVKKPVSIDTVKYAWQHVLREKIRKENENVPLGGLMAPNRLNERVGEEYLIRGYLSDGTGSDESYKSKKKIDCSKTANQDEAESYKLRCKLWIEWTEELHEKFMDATRKLGQGRCYPKQILELMNVPGLTRMQVASHLQKCRRGTWQHRKQRKPGTATSKTSNPVKAKRYGSMPKLGYKSQQHSSIGDNVLGRNIGEPSLKASHENLAETKKVEIFGLTSMPDDKFKVDVAPVGNDESKATDEIFEFMDIDSMMQSFCVSEQEQLDYSEVGIQSIWMLFSLTRRQSCSRQGSIHATRHHRN